MWGFADLGVVDQYVRAGICSMPVCAVPPGNKVPIADTESGVGPPR